MKTKLFLFTVVILFSGLCFAQKQADSTVVAITDTYSIQPGFKCMINGGVGFDFSGFSVISADAIFGSQTTPGAFFGGGLGFAKYQHGSTFLLPVYFYARLNSTETKNKFYTDLKLGYSLNGALFLSPSVGIRFGNNKNACNIGIGYRLQGGIIGLHWENYNYQDSSDTMHSIDFRIGYEF